MLRTTLCAATALAALTLPARAEIVIADAYARAAMPGAPTGAAFMVIENTADADDRLIDARSDIAARVELHTHIEDDQGVMRMREVEEGFVIPAGGAHRLARGGDHVMFLGLTQSLAQGDTVSVTLVFERAGDVAVDVPVDLERMPAHGGMSHGD